MMNRSPDAREQLQVMKSVLEEMQEHLHEMIKALRLARALHVLETAMTSVFIESAIKDCKNATVVRWLRENSESESFSKLIYMFDFLQKRIAEEEKKNHGDSVDITLVAHGAIRDSMIPASCLLPLAAITDVLLYSPWNCTLSSDAVYGIATGRLKPQHRVFRCTAKNGCQVPNDKHEPAKLPEHWNSMRRAGDHLIPNITLSPLNHTKDPVWQRFQTLSQRFGEPERNRIVIPFMLPAGGDAVGSVPFSVVTLALSLVLCSSRFTATVHLAACLGDQSAGRKFSREDLETQYSVTKDNTVMTASPDQFSGSWIGAMKHFFGFS